MPDDMPELGTEVTTTVHSIGGRSEAVTGIVVDHRRKSVTVQTQAHGRIVVPLSELSGRGTCTCPDDCNCRSAHRTNYCGCRAHTR